MKIKEIATEINRALTRWERDPALNPADPTYHTKPYCMARAFASSNRVFVVYVGYQGSCSLTKAQALAYLEWIRAGNVGSHYDMEVTA